MKNDIAWGEAECNIVFQSAIKMILYKGKCDIYCIILYTFCAISDPIYQNRYHPISNIENFEKLRNFQTIGNILKISENLWIFQTFRKKM